MVIPPGQNILLDVSPPQLYLIIIEGSLTFDDTQDINLDASYIFIRKGSLVVGTEDNPYLHKVEALHYHHIKFCLVESPIIRLSLCCEVEIYSGGVATHTEWFGVISPLYDFCMFPFFEVRITRNIQVCITECIFGQNHAAFGS